MRAKKSIPSSSIPPFNHSNAGNRKAAWAHYDELEEKILAQIPGEAKPIEFDDPEEQTRYRTAMGHRARKSGLFKVNQRGSELYFTRL